MIPANFLQFFKLSAAVILMILSANPSECSPQEYYMTNFCSSHINLRVDGSLLLHFTPQTSLPLKRPQDAILLRCQLSISAMDRTNRLLLHIVKLHIDLKHPDRLHIFELSGERLLRLSPAAGLYGKYGGVVQISSDGITDYKTTGDTFYLDYEGLPTQEFSGFTILFTEFHAIPDYVGSCLGSFFQCSVAKICIASSLLCDKYRNCGEYDNSDEMSCRKDLPSDSQDGSYDSTMPIALSVGIVATLTFLLVSLAIFLVTRLRRRQMESRGRVRRSLRGSLTQRGETTESGLNLATLYAPPSYEDVMSRNCTLNRDNPPPYDSLVSLRIEEISLPIGTDVTGTIRDTSLSLPATPISAQRANRVIIHSRNDSKDDDTPVNITTATCTDSCANSNSSSENTQEISHDSDSPDS